MTTTRAIHEIQCDGIKIATVKLTSAIDACDWAAVHEYAKQLEEIAQRGLYHASQERQKEITAFAMRGYKSEPDAR